MSFVTEKIEGLVLYQFEKNLSRVKEQARAIKNRTSEYHGKKLHKWPAAVVVRGHDFADFERRISYISVLFGGAEEVTVGYNFLVFPVRIPIVDMKDENWRDWGVDEYAVFDISQAEMGDLERIES